MKIKKFAVGMTIFFIVLGFAAEMPPVVIPLLGLGGYALGHFLAKLTKAGPGGDSGII